MRPTQGERLYLRMLLSVVPGAKSYEALKTTDLGAPNERVHETYQAACLASM